MCEKSQHPNQMEEFSAYLKLYIAVLLDAAQGAFMY